MANISTKPQSNKPHIVIIGGGITGLAAAHRLLEKSNETGEPIEITLLEANGRLGGVIQTEHHQGFLLERGPDSFISEKPEVTQLAQRLGIETHLIETNNEHRRSFIVRDGRLKPVPEGFQLLAPSRLWPFITSEIFSFSGKARMAADLFLPRGKTNGNDDESLGKFVRRRLGREALERMAQPMVGGIYTADPEKLSLRATFPRLTEMERRDRSIILAMWKRARRQSDDTNRGTSGARYSLFLSFAQGMQFLVDKLAERISTLNRLTQVSFRLNTSMQALTLARETEPGQTQRWRIGTNRGDALVADRVCLALPGQAAAKLLSELDRKLADELAAIEYASTATVNMGYRRAAIAHPLDGFGFVVPFVEKRSLIACTFSSIKFAARAPQGLVLLRAFVGGALQPEMFDLEEAEIVKRLRGDLRDLLGIEEPPLFTQVAKWARSMPQYHTGHIDRIKRIGERIMTLPYFALAGNAYSGAGIPDCIRSGQAAAEELLKT